jgi:putative FmdB family regulatory protein
VPLYEYRCVKCGRRTEKIESVAGPHLKKCPHCGGKVESVLTAPAIQFKGAGWYVTDYASKGKSSGDGDSAPTATTGSTETTAKDSGAKESSTKESKPTETKEKKPAKKK